MSALTNRVRACQRCKKETQQEVVRILGRSAAVRCVWWCSERLHGSREDGHVADGGRFIAHDKLTANGIDIELLRDVQTQIGPRCARCGARGAEEHHWAPHSMFDDSAAWPTDYLCRDCHARWHQIVTPGLVRAKVAG
jgi:DNA-directed RNA polymerase subunit RPC12/RpoP